MAQVALYRVKATFWKALIWLTLGIVLFISIVFSFFSLSVSIFTYTLLSLLYIIINIVSTILITAATITKPIKLLASLSIFISPHSVFNGHSVNYSYTGTYYRNGNCKRCHVDTSVSNYYNCYQHNIYNAHNY